MIFVAVIIVAILIFLLVEYNIFVNLRNKIKQSKSSIDVYLNQRFDLIPNLVECVKGYSNYEKEVLTELAELRQTYKETKNLDTASNLNHKMNSVIAVAENNPELKASEQYVILQKNLVKMESQLQAARRIYNGDVTLYNTTIQSFPSNILAGMFGFKEAELFTIEEYKAQNIKVEV